MIDRYKIGKQVSLVGIAVNLVLSIFKFLAGILSHSGAMVADALHSVSDILTTVVVIVSLKIAQKPEDREHPYGHEKAESIAAKMVAGFLLLAGLGIGWQAVKFMIQGQSTVPGVLALYAAVVSIIVKEALFWYTMLIGKKINSTALEADAWHHRSDAFSSIATLIGIGAARLGYPLGDPIAAIAVSIMIIKVAYDIYAKSIKELMDTSAPSETVDSIRKTILSISKVKGIDNLRTRIHGNVIYADTDILVDNFITVSSGHDIAKNVEDTIKAEFPNVKAVMVHINPCDPSRKEFCHDCQHPCSEYVKRYSAER